MSGPTFGELVERGGVRARASRVTRDVIRRSAADAVEDARVYLHVITCDTCTATKGCCAVITTAYLSEAIPIAARLLAERRDTAALRKQLRAAADEMESSGFDYAGRCAFLDPAERCTIYDDRPSVCGTHLVSSPAELCSTPGADVMAFQAPLQDTVPGEHAAAIARSLGLEPIGTQYFGVMPRMVLLCLEAWPRRDYVRFLAKHARTAAARIAAMSPESTS